MKKIIALVAFFMAVAVVSVNAQETKTKPVTTVGDKAHNVVHPHNKQSHGTKTKHKSSTGKKTVTQTKTSEPVPMEEKKKSTK